jgi:hypothetical protein
VNNPNTVAGLSIIPNHKGLPATLPDGRARIIHRVWLFHPDGRFPPSTDREHSAKRNCGRFAAVFAEILIILPHPFSRPETDDRKRTSKAPHIGLSKQAAHHAPIIKVSPQ